MAMTPARLLHVIRPSSIDGDSRQEAKDTVLQEFPVYEPTRCHEAVLAKTRKLEEDAAAAAKAAAAASACAADESKPVCK